MTTLPTSLRLASVVVDGRRLRTYPTAAETWLVGFADLTAILIALAATREPAVLLGAAVSVVFWRSQGLYRGRLALSVLDDVWPLTLGAIWGVMAQVLLGDSPRAALPPLAVFVASSIVARGLAYHRIVRWRALGRVRRPTVVVGAGLNGVSLAHRIVEHPHTGLNPVGFLDDDAPEGTLPLPLLGSPTDLARVVTEYQVSHVIVAYGRMPTAELVSVLRTCHRLDVDIYVLPRLFEMHRLTADSDHVWGLPLVPVRQPIAKVWSRRVKRAVDVVLSGLALVLLAPVMAVVAALVRWDLGPGVFFTQDRVGLDGHPFTVRKFRSMKHLPEGVENPWTVDDHERFGRVGKVIRRYSLDEIPQLWSVLVGDMSLVGPRPERPHYVDQFGLEFPRYHDRHRVQAGLTGLAAVEGLRGDTSIEDRAYFDNLYIENWSLWLDTKILFRTITAVLKGTGG